MTGDAEFAEGRGAGDHGGRSAGDHGAWWRLTQPLGNAVSMIIVVSLTLVVLALSGLVWNNGSTFLGTGRGSVCVDTPTSGLTVGNVPNDILAHPRAGASTSISHVDLCANHPTAHQRALGILAQGPEFLYYLAILLILSHLLRTARRAGPFAAVIARRLRFLGWFVLAGYVAVNLVQGVAMSYFAESVATDSIAVSNYMIQNVVGGILTPLLLACGLLTLARIMRAGAQMNDDLAGTV
jgi:hypothetical protein